MAKLTGTNPDQVPTNADLGTMAYQDKDNVNVGSFTSNGIDDNATSTAMTLDTSGNLLVGRTSTAFSGTGHIVQSNGIVYHMVDGAAVQYLRRNTSDGDIVRFYKDTTEVGSIGTATNEFEIKSSGSRYLELQSIVGLYNSDWTGNLQMTPTVSSVDLGNTGTQWDNLFLSGGVYLGGTGAANKLDDYEQGTFNVELWAGGTQLALSQYGGSYVKVGNLVTINFEADCSNTNGAVGPLEVRGMPFTIADVISPTGIEANGSISYWQNWSTSINSPSLYAEGGTTLLYVMGSTSSTVASSANLTAANIGTGEFRGTITYRST